MAERPPSSRGHDRELWVGLFVFVGIVIGVVLLYVLTDPSAFRGRYHITTMVPDAGGIRKRDPVTMRGVVIGRVMDFRIQKEKVAVQLEVEGEYPIPKGSVVEIKAK